MASAPVRIQETVKFGEGFEFDPRTRTLRRAGRVLKLERIPTEILFCLIQRKEELVGREQIVERIWGKGVFLDTDNSINGAVRKIRQALKDDPEQPRYIQTITGKGYRFIAPVLAPGEKPPAETTGPSAAPLPLHSEKTFPLGFVRWRWVALASAFVLLISVVGMGWLWGRYNHRTQPAGRAMLAVLPFQNLTGDSAQEYFSDGFTEEMITQLGKLDPQHLGVIARTSIMTYKAVNKPLAEIAHELGVQYVLEGSVRRDSGKVRISAQLIQAGDQTHLWARDYDRELNNLLVLQTEIAEEIADEVELTLAHDHVRTPVAHSVVLSPGAYEAYDLYLKGRYFWNKRNPEGFRQAVTCFQQAIEKNPADARAYAGLADSYAMMSGYYLVSPRYVMPKAREAALKALEIDDSLAEAHTSLAVISQNYNWDWQTAEKEYRRAIQLNPNYATAHQWYAEFLAFQGRFDEALAESERAHQLDPLSLIIAADNGAIYYFARQYDRAIERFRAVLDMDPTFTRAHLIVGAYVQKQQFKEALADIDTWRQGDQGAWIWAWETYIYGAAGDKVKARHALEQAQRAVRSDQSESASMLSTAYLGVHDNNQVLAYLEKAYQERSNLIASLKVDPAYDPVRNDPRFQVLLKRVGLTR